MNLNLLNIFLVSVVGTALVNCTTHSINYGYNETEILKTNQEIEFGNARMPAGQTIVNEIVTADKKMSQTVDGLAFSATTLASLQGTWSSKCTKAYAKGTQMWFLETLKFEAAAYTKSIVQFSDSACKKPLQQVINSKVKIDMTVSTSYGFRLTNNWDETKQTVSSPSIRNTACSQETVFPGCAESAYAPARKNPWFLGTLNGSDELLTDKHSPEFTNCEKPELVNGEKWCLRLQKR